MSDTESKQDTTKNDVSVAETNVKENKNTEITNMNSRYLTVLHLTQ